MRRRLALVGAGLLLLGAIEVVVLYLVAGQIGVPLTVLLVLATTVLGGWLLRWEGLRAWRAFRAASAAGRPPGRAVGTGLVGLLGAVLLLLPGFVTDALGLVLLTPPVRRLTRAGVQRLAEARLSGLTAGGLFGPRRVRVHREAAPPRGAVPGEVVEGEIVDPP